MSGSPRPAAGAQCCPAGLTPAIPAAAAFLLFGGLGYRPPFPAGRDEAAAMVLADGARYLAGADLYILATRPHQRSAAPGAEENRVVGEYTPGEQVQDRDDTFMPRSLYAW